MDIEQIPPFARNGVIALKAAYEESRADSVAPYLATFHDSVGSVAEHWFSPLASRKTTVIEVPNLAFEELYRVPLQDLVDGFLDRHVSKMLDVGANAKLWADQLIARLLRENPETFDGEQLFCDRHPAQPTKTFSNDLRAALTDWQSVCADMAKRSGEDGSELGIKPTLALVPSGMWDEARTVLGSTVVIVELSQLEDQETWYALDCSRTALRPFLVQRRQPFVFALDQKNWDLFVGSRGRGNVSTTWPALITRCRAR